MSPLLEHLLTRRTVPAKQMSGPGPDEDALETLLTIGMRVPDHGKLAPWRYIIFQGAAREKAGALCLARYEALKGPLSDEIRARELTRFTRVPLVICVVASLNDQAKVPVWEQEMSAGAVCMNLVHGAKAIGYSAQWLSEWYSYDEEMLAAFGVQAHEKVAGFIAVGSPDVAPSERPRPVLADKRTDWV